MPLIRTTSCDVGSISSLSADKRIPRIRSGLSHTSLILLACMCWGVPIAHAQVSLEDLQKRKTIAEAEKAAIEAEIARDEALKKRSELVAPLDSLQKANEAAVEAANSTNASANAGEAQSEVKVLCLQCLKAAEDGVKKCLEAAISQEDKKSCHEKRDTRTKACTSGQCKIEKAQSANTSAVPLERR